MMLKCWEIVGYIPNDVWKKNQQGDTSYYNNLQPTKLIQL